MCLGEAIDVRAIYDFVNQFLENEELFFFSGKGIGEMAQ